MTEDQFVEYRDGRYAALLTFYDNRAISNQRGFRICALWILVVSLSITPLISFNNALSGWGNAIAELLSTTIALAAGLNAHFQYHENWLRYRAAWDVLRHEQALCTAGVGEYSDKDNRYALFVEKIEAIVAQEGSSWRRTHFQDDRNIQFGGTA